MTTQNELRDRIARILFDRDQITLERRGYFKMRWDESDAKYLKPWREEAQAIIDDLGLTHGYRTAYSHDHPDGENQKRVVGKWEKQ